MDKQELKKKIGIEVAVAYQLGIKGKDISVPTIVKNIFAIFEVVGYQSPEEVRRGKEQVREAFRSPILKGDKW